jgi:hypothetical protein
MMASAGFEGLYQPRSHLARLHNERDCARSQRCWRFVFRSPKRGFEGTGVVLHFDP